MKKKRSKLSTFDKVRLIFIGFLILSGSFMFATMIRLIPVVVMMAAVITGSPALIAGILSFVYLWFSAVIIFLASIVILVILRYYSIKNKKKRI